LGNFCAVNEAGIVTEAAVARMDQIIASDGLTVTMEAMLNHPVIKKDEISVPTAIEPDDVIKLGPTLLWLLTLDGAQGCEERRLTLRKAGVLGVLPPVVAAFTKAEIKAGMHPDAGVPNNKVKASYLVAKALVGTDRLAACIEGEDPLSDILTEGDVMVIIGTKEQPGFYARCVGAGR